MAATAIFNHAMTAGQAMAAKTANPLDSSAGGTGSSAGSSGDSATISANDFLTLLVTEMQNQDPTADTDPNEYINQLVQVNSLEQLININQTLSTDLGAPASGASSDSASNPATAAAASATGPAAAGNAGGAGRSALTALQSTGRPGSTLVPPTTAPTATAPAATALAATKRAPGNLSVPRASPASQRVAHALDGQPHSRPLGGRLSAFERSSQNKIP